MIQKIVEWTAGSFFRTIGRLLVFVIIGFLVAKLVDFSSIKWTDLLGIETLKADTYNGVYVGSSSARTGTNTQWYTMPISGDKYWLGTWTANGSNRYIYKFGNSSAASTQLENNVSYMLFNVKLEVFNQDTINLDHMQCYFAGSQMSSGYPIYSQLNCNVDGNTQNGTIEHYDVSLSVNYWYNNNVDLVTSCYIQSYANNVYTIMCPKITDNISGLQFNINTGRETTFNLGFNYLWTKVYDSSSVISGEIENQTQQQQQQHNETMSYFQDDNTTSSEDEASSFFDDFSVIDHGGLSSILTAPLTIVSKVLDDTCTPATFTYRNKQVTLPCGQYFWNQAPELRDWLSTIESGIIAYAILVALFKMIQKLESPSNSEVEVESL